MLTVPPSSSTQLAAGEQRDLTPGLDAEGLLGAQVREVHRLLDEGLTESLRAVAAAAPPAGSRVVALYVHAATIEDVTIQSLLRRVAPVYETDWPGRGPARYSTADLMPLRAYAQQVFAATDAYLAGLATAEASETVDLRRLGQGQPTIAWVVSKFVVLQLAQIYGELTSAARAGPQVFSDEWHPEDGALLAQRLDNLPGSGGPLQVDHDTAADATLLVPVLSRQNLN